MTHNISLRKNLSDSSSKFIVKESRQDMARNKK